MRYYQYERRKNIQRQLLRRMNASPTFYTIERTNISRYQYDPQCNRPNPPTLYNTSAPTHKSLSTGLSGWSVGEEGVEIRRVEVALPWRLPPTDHHRLLPGRRGTHVRRWDPTLVTLRSHALVLRFHCLHSSLIMESWRVERRRGMGLQERFS